MEKQLCVQRNIIDIYNCMYGSDARVARTINEPINALDSGLVAALWPAYTDDALIRLVKVTCIRVPLSTRSCIMSTDAAIITELLCAITALRVAR